MQDLAYQELFPVDSPQAVLREVLEILNLISLNPETEKVRRVFGLVEHLYQGKYPGYKACNTGYHDFRHAIDTLLAMSRLIHGTVVAGDSFSARHIYLGMVAAILHDVGYIQEISDRRGTGAKYTVGHEQRSMDFLSRHGAEYELSSEEIAQGRTLIFCTDLGVDISAVLFQSAQIEQLGRMLSAADLMAQLADRFYLEKLLFLYKEHTEAGLGDHQSELSFLHKAVEFYDIFEQRLKTTLSKANEYMQLHFASKWNIDKNLYRQMIEDQKKNLLKILKTSTDPVNDLRNGQNFHKI
jgi:hypothetical protein